MLTTSKIRKIIIALFITVVIIIAFFAWFDLEKDIPGNNIGNAFVFSFLTQWTIFLLGSLTLLLRIVAYFGLPDSFEHKISSYIDPNKFFYILIGSLNLYPGLLSILLYGLKKADIFMVWDYLGNLIIGIIFFLDIIFFSTQIHKQTN